MLKPDDEGLPKENDAEDEDDGCGFLWDENPDVNQINGGEDEDKDEE